MCNFARIKQTMVRLMKKMTLALTAMLMVTTAVAQHAGKTTLAESKITDNWYIGVNAGVSAPTTHYSWVNNLNPECALRIGRYLTPAFGLAAEGTVFLNDKPAVAILTVAKSLNTMMMATVNLSNLLGGYNERLRLFEVVALPGLGWSHTFGTSSNIGYGENHTVSKMAFDLAFNLGKARIWQLYLEPSVVYVLSGQSDGGFKYNANRSTVQLNLGLNYRFRNSNGTHNFLRVGVRNQYEVDRLNQQVNELRYELREKEKTIARHSRTIAELRDSLEAASRPRLDAIVKDHVNEGDEQ